MIFTSSLHFLSRGFSLHQQLRRLSLAGLQARRTLQFCSHGKHGDLGDSAMMINHD
jgi:hypothetical protein